MKNLKSFLNTMVGSWLKVFLACVLAGYMQLLATGHDIGLMDGATIKTLIASGLAVLIPVIINYLNPADPRYGKKEAPNE